MPFSGGDISNKETGNVSDIAKFPDSFKAVMYYRRLMTSDDLLSRMQHEKCVTNISDKETTVLQNC